MNSPTSLVLKFSLLILVLAGLLTGCAHFVDEIVVRSAHNTYAIYGSRTVGQTFVCHHAGLDGISVMLSARAEAGDVVLHLRESADSAADIAMASVSPSSQTGQAFYHFVLPLQDDVKKKSFFLLIESPTTSADGALVIPYSSTPAKDITLYLDGVPTAGYLSFKLHYRTTSIVEDLGRRAISSGIDVAWRLFLSALLYLLPGGVLVVWLLRDGNWIERTIVALGLSVAANALLVYLTLAGLRLNSPMVVGFLTLCGAGILTRWILDWRQGRFQRLDLGCVWRDLGRDLAPLALLVVLGLVLGVRLFVLRDLVAPMWGDGYQHTMIAQLLVDNGGLFESWEPYAPLTTFTYHFGFHANVALFHWLGGDSLAQSVLWIGQILNVLAALVLYPLAIKVSDGNRWAGVGAVLIAGLLSPMPMVYLNWGRYTQLAGQVILPVALVLVWTLLERSHLDPRLVLLCCLSAAGMAVTHYRILLFFAVFIVSIGLVFVQRSLPLVVLRLGLLTVGTALLFLPWVIHMLGGQILLDFGRNMTSNARQLSAYVQQYNAIGDLSQFLPMKLWVLLLAASIVGLWRRRQGVLIVCLWCLGLLIATNPSWLSLPGTGAITNFALFIAAYIPAGLLGGYLGGLGIELLRRWRWAYGLAPFMCVMVLVPVSLKARTSDVQPQQHALVTDADLRAMQWIRENTPPDARFLVNSFFAYRNSAIVGSDAGWWLPLLAQRANTVPPLTYSKEEGTWPGYREWVNELARQVQRDGPSAPAVVESLWERGVTHVYIGQKQGRVNYSGTDVLNPDDLAASPYYRLLYHEDDVWIFALDF